MRYAGGVRPALALSAALLVALATGCGPSELLHLARDPSPAHILFFLLFAPLFWVAKVFLEALVGEAIAALLPDWLRTRRAVWTAVALATIATIAAVVYWNTPPRR